MAIIGILIALIGVALLTYGITQNNSMQAQMESLFTNGSTDPGTIWIIVGVVVIVVGIIFWRFSSRRK